MSGRRTQLHPPIIFPYSPLARVSLARLRLIEGPFAPGVSLRPSASSDSHRNHLAIAWAKHIELGEYLREERRIALRVRVVRFSAIARAVAAAERAHRLEAAVASDDAERPLLDDERLGAGLTYARKQSGAIRTLNRIAPPPLSGRSAKLHAKR